MSTDDVVVVVVDVDGKTWANVDGLIAIDSTLLTVVFVSFIFLFFFFVTLIRRLMGAMQLV